MSLDSSKWRFRGEGNASLVLVNAKEKRVYRFPKYTHWGKGHLIATEKTKSERVHEELQLVVDYMSNVMQPLLSPSFVVLPDLSLIPAGLTEEAETQIQVTRPAQRKGKDVEAITIDSTTISALVLPDLCYVKNNQSNSTAPTLSIEIKPKKAFMHTRDSLSDVTDELSQVCKFCMHQRLKAKEGQWPNTSQYCPLDLFSGERSRMKQALLALAETPQNNLRICQNGEEIHGAWNKEDLSEIFEKFFGNWPNGLTNGLWKQQALHTFLDLVLEALLYVPADNKENKLLVKISSNYCVQCGNELPVKSSSRNHVRCIDSREQSVKSSHSVQYCQNSSVVDYKRTLSESGQAGLVLDLKEPVIRSLSWDGSIVDSSCPITDCCHGNCSIQWPTESLHRPVQCCYKSSSKLIENQENDCELPPGCVLERVLTAQRLDSLDIHGIFPLYQHIERYLRENPTQRCQLCLDGPYTQSSWLCQCIGEQRNCQSTIEETYMQDSVQKVKRFLVSKTVQDCSIMVALQALTEGESDSSPCISDPYGGRYRFSVSIIDLDPKPFCKIPTYHRQDREIVNAYKEACSRQDGLENGLWS